MTSTKEYREFAAECLLWATAVASEKDRQIFLDMARDWTLAAIRLEGLLIPNGDFQVGEPQPGSTGTGE